MINYGNAPTADEVEVIVFGPGFGEAIAVHLGEGHWILIDSCMGEDRNTPAALDYLSAIGVQADQVRIIVASHWHDDHVRGISQVADAYPDADFFIPAVFTNPEALSFLAAYSGVAAPKQTRGAAELYKVVKGRPLIHAAQERSTLLELAVLGHNVRVTSLSPSAQAFAQSVAHFSQYLPETVGSPINHAPELKPNLESVVVHIDLGHDAILLGSDLESTGSSGWSALVADSWCGNRPKAGVYKLAHHGSKTGHHDLIWKNMLKASPHVSMTPFHYGRHRLPETDDIARVKGLSNSAYISSASSKKPDNLNGGMKRLSDICKGLNKVNAGFGAIRMRKKIVESNWSVELFGAAQPI